MTTAARYAEYLESVSPENIDKFDLFVTEDVFFSDPFQEVRGRDLLKNIFLDMLVRVGPVKFQVLRIFEEDREAVLIWEFTAVLVGKKWTVPGVSRIVFDQNEKITEHIDVWDSGRYFLMKIPVIGQLVSWFYRRIAH